MLSTKVTWIVCDAGDENELMGISVGGTTAMLVVYRLWNCIWMSEHILLII